MEILIEINMPAIAILTRRHDELGFLCKVMYETIRMSILDGKPSSIASDRSFHRIETLRQVFVFVAISC